MDILLIALVVVMLIVALELMAAIAYAAIKLVPKYSQKLDRERSNLEGIEVLGQMQVVLETVEALYNDGEIGKERMLALMEAEYDEANSKLELGDHRRYALAQLRRRIDNY